MTAGAVATRGPSAAPGPELEVRGAVIEAVDLFPTRSHSPDPKQVATGVLELDSPGRLVAQCECEPGTPEAQQFEDLVIEVHGPDGKLYAGPLAGLGAAMPAVDKKSTLKVWLADTGKPQAQGVETRFSLVATAASATSG